MVLELRGEKWTFVKVMGGKVDFFICRGSIGTETPHRGMDAFLLLLLDSFPQWHNLIVVESTQAKQRHDHRRL
jgi:hypothetical protein